MSLRTSLLFRGVLLAAVITLTCDAQPTRVKDGIMFRFTGKAQQSVSLVGDFNGWSRREDPLQRRGDGLWEIVRKLPGGIFQYLFVVDDSLYLPDASNPASIENYNQTGRNSVFVVTQSGDVVLTAEIPKSAGNTTDRYEPDPTRKPLYLNIIWHQHQPLYVNPETDQLRGPWVRTHATKDYFDMAAMLERYPDIHCNINLTSSLLLQLQYHYVDRLAPFVDVTANTIDAGGFLAQWRGKTDPWIDLALTPAEEFGENEKDFLYRNTWNAFGISEVMIGRFPQYKELKQKLDVDQQPGFDPLTIQEMREAKLWFYLAHFDPDFLLGAVHLPDGSVCDLSDLVERREDGGIVLRRPATEADCRRVVAEAVKVMANVLPVHKQLMYDPDSGTGQIEVITTPYYHPILPLIYDTDLARECQSEDELPGRFSFPEDARAQVAKAVQLYRDFFGRSPKGLWPGEGSVAQPVLEILRENGIIWTASDEKLLKRSIPEAQPNTSPYRIPAGSTGPIVMVFRDTELSDRIGFKYQTYNGEEAAEDFVQTILARRPLTHEPDALLTVILDGENAWEWYRNDMDGKTFLHALYRKLSRLQEIDLVITTTTTEYLEGNKARNIPPHPLTGLPGIERLFPGSWINASYDTWIGEPEENTAWEYLLRTRRDLEQSGLSAPDPVAPRPPAGDPAYYPYMAWESIYAAEGSDWFWWYGADQSAPAGDRPFDEGYRTHLKNVYRFMSLAGKPAETPDFPSILRSGESRGGAGAMARGTREEQTVVFTCDSRVQVVATALFISGNMKSLGLWVPNKIRMYDDGSHGDAVAGDGIWSLEVRIPVGTEVQYKYTNSGIEGSWLPGEEFPGGNRSVSVGQNPGGPLVISDVFGKMNKQ